MDAPFGAPPPSLSFEGLFLKREECLGRKARRENALTCHCEERSDEAIQGRLALNAGLLRYRSQ
jgi:hypothetical protein